MSNYKYLPQSIVAYDKKDFDKSVNLIHAATAIPSQDYFCPCCGNVLKVSCLNNKQEYYFHKDGECSKEIRLHWFCENWLFKKGSQFKIESDLFTVKEISFDQVYNTTFGSYSPALTVSTKEGKEIFFEIFFKMNKTETDYFCKWKELNNDVIDIDLDQLQQKQSSDDILEFKYLYHEGICYSKEYVKKDLYLQTIGKKIKLDRLNQFWTFVQTKGFKDEELFKLISTMTREEKLVCHDIISKKQCLKYLKPNILNLINDEVKEYLRKQVKLPDDNQNVYIDLIQHNGRTYEISLVIEYIAENVKIHEIPYHLVEVNPNEYAIQKGSEYLKIIFKNQIFDFESVTLNKNQISQFHDMYKLCIKWLHDVQNFIKQVQDIDSTKYKIFIQNNVAEVIVKDNRNEWQKIQHKIVHDYNIESLQENIKHGLDHINHIIFLENYFKSIKFINKVNDYYERFQCKVDFNRNIKSYNANCNQLTFNFINKDEEIIIIESFPDIYNKEETLDKGVQACFDTALQEYNYVILRQNHIQDLITQINSCKNKLWFVEGKNNKYFIHLYLRNKKGTIIKDFQSYINFHKEYEYEDLKEIIYESMKLLLIKAENNGIRVLEEKNEG